jgi:oligoendopeptidase F
MKFPTLRLQDGSDVVLSPGNFFALLQQNRDQAERGKAAASHLGAYAATANTYASIYNGTLQRDWFVARARNFDTTLDAALDANAIPRAVVETLIDATRAGSAPFQRYARLRQKLLGLPSYHLYDATIPIYRSDKIYPTRRRASSPPHPWRRSATTTSPSSSDSCSAAGSTSTRTKASAAAPTAPACTASAPTC